VVNQYKEGKVGDVSLLHSENAAVSLAGKWNYRVSAEAYKSI
jgi:hypothetical protein